MNQYCLMTLLIEIFNTKTETLVKTGKKNCQLQLDIRVRESDAITVLNKIMDACQGCK